MRMETAAILKSDRDERLDLLRGLALLMIFVDHVTGNPLRNFTVRMLGFSDAAHWFVFISGFAAALAYGKALDRGGLMAMTWRVWHRVWQLYLTHIFLLFMTFALVTGHVYLTGTGKSLIVSGYATFLEAPLIAPLASALLMLQPRHMDILPLYMALLAVFPLALLGLRRNPALVLGLSAALWVLVQFVPMPIPLFPSGEMDFNPLAWQFLFILGAWCGSRSASGQPVMPDGRWVLPTATLILLAFVLLRIVLYLRAPGVVRPDLPETTMFLNPLDKSTLRPLHLLHFLCLAVVAARLLPRRGGLLTWSPVRPVILCGRHSLHVFAAGVFLSFVGSAALENWAHPVTILLVNAGGIGTLMLLAWGLSRHGERAGYGTSLSVPRSGHPRQSAVTP